MSPSTEAAASSNTEWVGLILVQTLCMIELASVLKTWSALRRDVIVHVVLSR